MKNSELMARYSMATLSAREVHSLAEVLDSAIFDDSEEEPYFAKGAFWIMIKNLVKLQEELKTLEPEIRDKLNLEED